MNGLFHYLHTLVKKNGPVAEDYSALNAWIDKVVKAKHEGIINEKDITDLREVWGDAFSAETMQGFSYLKPRGYAGDFEIIDRLYMKYISPKPHLARWDAFYQNHDAARAVRNRRTYLRKVILAGLKKKKSLKILNVGSGPGRDMQYYFDREIRNRSRVFFDCLEQDDDAIAHCRGICRDYLTNISFMKGNILRYTPPAGRYDLVWASGLFDYFNDRIFARMFRKLLTALAPGGECVIGNFSIDNPSRNYMELFEWCLHYRSATELKDLARSCGIKERNMKIGRDRTGVNLFLHVYS